MVSAFRALTIQSGVTTQIGPTSQLQVGNGIDSDAAGSLTIGSSLATSVVLGGSTTANVTAGANNPNFDFSSSSGTFMTSSGAVSVNGNTTLAAGKNLTAAAGSGAFDFSGQTGAFMTGTGAVSLNGNTTVTGSNTFTTGSGTVTVQGSVTTSGNPNFDFSGSTGTFKTSTGANTLGGDTTLAANKNLSAAAGTGAVDFSAASGLFKTSTGAVTIGTGAVTVSGVTTFTASGTALTVNNNATVSGVTTASGGVLTPSVDTVSAGALAIGPTTATSVTITPNTTISGTTTLTGSLTSNDTANGFHTAGVVHNSAAGLFSSSLIVNADVSASAAIAYSKLNLGNSIVNSDINTAAAISVSKLAGGSTAQVLMTNGSTPTWTTFSGDATVSATGVVTVVSAAGNFEVKGNLTVDGTETIIGTSVFQSNVTIDGNLTIPGGDGYVLTVDSIASNGSDVLNINGGGGIDLQKAGTTYLDVGVTSSGIMYVPSGVTLQATGTGQIIATSSTGTAEITIGADTSAVGAANDAVYVSGSGAVSSAEANALSTAYCVGFAKDKSATGHVYTDGLVTPNVTGSAAPGNVMYLDPANPGKVTATAPSTVGQYVAPVGIMLSAIQMIVRVQLVTAL